MSVPKLRFGEFSGDWEEKKLGDICIKVGSGKTPRGGNSQYAKNGILFIRSQNVHNGKLILSDIAYITDVTNREMKNSIVLNNDILLNITGASIGRSCVVPIGVPNANVNQHVCIIRLNDLSNSVFILNQIISDRIQRQIESFQAGGNREGLNFQQIKSMKIGYATLPEQEKIADFLSTFDEKIENQQGIVNSLENQKKGFMQKIFSKELRFKDENGGEFGDWVEMEIIDVSLSGIRNGAFNNPKNVGKGYSLINVVNLYSEPYIDDTQLELLDVTEVEYNKNSVKFGDIFFTRSSLKLEGIAHCNIYLGDREDIIFECHIMKLTPNNKIAIPLFLKYCFTSQILRQQFMFRAKTTTMTTISQEDIAHIKFLIPTLPEQQKIANFLSTLDEKIDVEKQILDKLKLAKKGLLQQMFC